MPKKQERKEPSCPLWLATYGDMVTNMLVFFVLLVSMSEIKKDDRFVEFMQAMREAFGYIGGMEQLPTEIEANVKNTPLSQMLVNPIFPKDFSKVDDPGVDGKQSTVTDMRPRDHITEGGPVHFDELTAELSPAGKVLVGKYAEKLRGYRTQVEVRGHCSRVPVDGVAFADHYALAFNRARAVAAELMAQGIAEDRIVLVGAGVNEPVTVGAYTPAQRRENDRVEIFQIDTLVEEYRDPNLSPSGDPPVVEEVTVDPEPAEDSPTAANTGAIPAAS